MARPDYGRPPLRGWAKLVPEIFVESFDVSVRHWCEVFGFRIAYQRPEERFAYLERPEGCQIMISERCNVWETGPLERPFGRGVLFQVFVDTIDPLHGNILRKGFALYDGPREVWRRWGDREGGKKEIFVQDPDGYLVMFAEDLGERPLP
jgi:catechol 2,3-dioxygenase-like lactoylglutathione lyase family enzyme